MYRIKLGSGEEAVFRSTEELAVAVRTGVVSPMAEVFHNAANRWLPIHVHPDYRAAALAHVPAAMEELPTPAAPEGPTRKVPGLAVAPQEPPAPTEESPDAAPALPSTAEMWVPSVRQESEPSPDPDPEPEPEPDPSEDGLGGRARRASRAHQLRAILALAMGLTGIGLVGGGGYALWRFALPRLEQPRPGSRMSEGMPPAPVPTLAEPLAAPRADSFRTTYPAPTPPLPPAAAAVGRPTATAAGRTQQLPTTRPRSPGYFEAYADARAEMDDALAYISFQRIFEPSRFTSPESIRATRRMVAAAGNILRVYRGKEVMLEQTYRPDDPGGRGGLRESFEASEAARALLSDVDSLFSILVAQEDRLRWTGGAVGFDEARAAEAYFALRQEISSEVRSWRDSTETQSRVTMPRLLKAIDGTAPPQLTR